MPKTIINRYNIFYFSLFIAFICTIFFVQASVISDALATFLLMITFASTGLKRYFRLKAQHKNTDRFELILSCLMIALGIIKLISLT